MIVTSFRRALSSSITTVSKRNTFNPPSRHSFSVARNSKKNNKTLWFVIGGGALLLGWAAINVAESEDNKVTTTGTQKKRLIVLGSGWAALDVVNNVDTNLYDISVVSPRNYFLFTPLLASASVGTIEFTSVVEPLRKFCKRANTTIKYYEAACTDVFYDKNTIRCEEASGVPSAVKTFDLEYDYLVIAVGSQTNFMGVKGVEQNCFFLKELPDSKRIRKRIIDCLETANFPTQTDEERKRLLHFVVVGGGATGVEFCGELRDFVRQDIPKYYPTLADKVTITLVQSTENILNTYDLKIQQQFKKEGINIIHNARAIEVTPNEIVVLDKVNNQNINIPCGMTVWAAGVGPTPLTSKIAASIPGQTNNKALVADEYLRVKGIPNQNVYAVGDCLTVTQKKMIDKMAELFKMADLDGDGSLTLEELTLMFKKLIPEYPHLQPYSYGLKKHIQSHDTNQDGKLQIDEFKNLLAAVDKELKSVPTTAQAASQLRYLAKSLNLIAKEPTAPISAFYYNHMGSFAYVGGSKAVLDSSSIKGGGFVVWWLWRATYFSKQLSWRNRFSLSFDWVKTRLNGREISKV